MVSVQEDTAPRRVVISGIGAVSAAGPTAPDFWQALLDARVAAAPLAGLPRAAAGGRIGGYEGPAARARRAARADGPRQPPGA